MNKKRFISKVNPKFLNGIAHRGLHNEQFTENGMNAFKNAVDNDFAIELDIHLTSDGELVVCHDSELERTTGQKGIIEGLSLKAIKENYRLLDGGEIPTLREVLSMVNERVPVVVELKTYELNNKPLAKAALKLLNEVIKDKANIMIIAFDPRALLAFGKHGYMRSLLIAKSHDFTWKYRFAAESLDVEYVLLEEKKYQKYLKHHFVNVWTIDSEEKFNKVAKVADAVTFQYLPKELVKNGL